MGTVLEPAKIAEIPAAPYGKSSRFDLDSKGDDFQNARRAEWGSELRRSLWGTPLARLVKAKVLIARRKKLDFVAISLK
jgi:hypothetical protein